MAFWYIAQSELLGDEIVDRVLETNKKYSAVQVYNPEELEELLSNILLKPNNECLNDKTKQPLLYAVAGAEFYEDLTQTPLFRNLLSNYDSNHLSIQEKRLEQGKIIKI